MSLHHPARIRQDSHRPPSFLANINKCILPAPHLGQPSVPYNEEAFHFFFPLTWLLIVADYCWLLYFINYSFWHAVSVPFTLQTDALGFSALFLMVVPHQVEPQGLLNWALSSTLLGIVTLHRWCRSEGWGRCFILYCIWGPCPRKKISCWAGSVFLFCACMEPGSVVIPVIDETVNKYKSPSVCNCYMCFVATGCFGILR